MSELHLIDSHEKCKKCGKHFCIFCHVKSIDKYEDLEDYFPDLPEKNEEGEYEVVREGKLPEQGLIVSLVEKKKEVQLYKFINFKGKSLMMQGGRKAMEGKLSEMGDLKDKRFTKNVIKENIFIKTRNKQMEEEI